MTQDHQTSPGRADTWTPALGASPFEESGSGASGALDWDSELHNTGSDFTVLPEGDYSFTVTKFERQHHPGSAKLPPCSKAELTIVLDGGALGTAILTHNLFLHAKTEWRLYQFFESIGQHAKGSGKALKPRWNEVQGARGRCHAVVQEYHSNKYGETRQRNEITRFYALPAAQNAAPGPDGFTPAAQDTLSPAPEQAAPTAAEQTALPLPAAPRRYF